MITADHVKPGAAVHRRRPVAHDGRGRRRRRPVGVAPIAGWLTPNPGGTGPMTIACLMENTVDRGGAPGRRRLIVAPVPT
jgi:methylenetetrahydrofolate dehydrogenase (NADP+)/methenyltetrahydrofolate cyclohydrolase